MKMPSFREAKRIYGSNLTIGQQLKQMSDMAMEETWDNNIQSKVCYIYDYYHDNQPDKKDHMTYERTTKTRIDAKFIVKSYQSIDKDQVDYYIQFKPSQPVEFTKNDQLYYYEQDFRRKYGAEFPTGLYCDIPDEKGVYSSSSNSSNPHPGGYTYDILHPVTRMPCPKPQNGWRWAESTFLDYAKSGEIHWGNDHNSQPHIKKRLFTAREQLKSVIYEDNRAETKMLSDIFDGKKIFENPKPHNVISRIVDFVTSKDDIILDFFSGSACFFSALRASAYSAREICPPAFAFSSSSVAVGVLFICPSIML